MMSESHASILRISDERTLQLLDLYSKEPCLWNTQIEDYKNREKRTAAAEKIASLLDIPNFTAKHVMMKFKNLRNSYSQELKKISHSKATGAKGDELYKPRIFWFPKMDSFVRPHLQVARSREWNDSTHRSDAEEWMQYSVFNAKTPQLPDTNQADSQGSQASEEDDTEERKRKKETTAPCPAKKPRAEIEEQQAANQMLKDISSHLHVLISHNDDYFEAFGKYVASLLRTLPPKKALALQPRIVGMITAVGIENIGSLESSECQSSREGVEAPTLKVEPDFSE